LQTQDIPMKWEDSYVFYFLLNRELNFMGVTAGIFLASILLKEMRYLVYIRYLCWESPPDELTSQNNTNESKQYQLIAT
jgi:hypothetical protein